MHDSDCLSRGDLQVPLQLCSYTAHVTISKLFPHQRHTEVSKQQNGQRLLIKHWFVLRCTDTVACSMMKAVTFIYLKSFFNLLFIYFLKYGWSSGTRPFPARVLWAQLTPRPYGVIDTALCCYCIQLPVLGIDFPLVRPLPFTNAHACVCLCVFLARPSLKSRLCFPQKKNQIGTNHLHPP